MSVLRTLLKATAEAENPVKYTTQPPGRTPSPHSAFGPYRPGVLNLWELMLDALKDGADVTIIEVSA